MHDVRVQVNCPQTGVMIGRGALSTPWLFRDAWSLITTGTTPAEPALDEKMCVATMAYGMEAVAGGAPSGVPLPEAGPEGVAAAGAA